METQFYRDKPMVFQTLNQEAEYPMTDMYKRLRGQEVTFKVVAEHMPIVGPIIRHLIHKQKVRLPDQYVNDRMGT